MTQGKKLRAVIATSIAPFDMERQADAVASWLGAGFEVVSLNTEGEIEKVKARFPQVEFIRILRDARELTGKPLVFLDDLLAYLGKSGADICGIINSDVWLGVNSDFIPFLNKEINDGMVFGSRIDIDDLTSLHGHIYPIGFDYFFFRPAFAKNYPPSEFGIGIPWWDYWAPLLPLSKGITIKQLLPPIGYHVIHAINWSDALYTVFGRKFRDLLKSEGASLDLNAEVVESHGENAAQYLSALHYIHDGSKVITYAPKDLAATTISRHIDFAADEPDRYGQLLAGVYEKCLDACMQRSPAFLSSYLTIGDLFKKQLAGAHSSIEAWKKECKRIAGDSVELREQFESMGRIKDEISNWLVEKDIQASKLNHRISEKTLQIAELERRLEEKEKQKSEIERRLFGI